MKIYQVSSQQDLEAYGQWVLQRSHGTLWQSASWKTYQESLGRDVRIFVGKEEDAIQCSALIVIDKTKGGYSTWEIARGPLWHEGCNEADISLLLEKIYAYAKEEKCISMYISCLGELPSSQKSVIKYQVSERHIHPEATRIIDLSKTDDEILAQMKPKGRYNIKVARKHNVRVEQSVDIANYYALAKETAQRDGFRLPSKKTFESFVHDLEESFLLLAYEDSNSKPIAGLLGVAQNNMGIYYYGASLHAYRALMAPYMLQWEAMQLCKRQGCTSYDLLGIAPPDSGDGHPWSGISSFKGKFGGEVVEYAKEQEVVLQPMMKKVLGWKRKLLR